MNRFVRWGFALAILPVAACADNKPPPAPAAPPAPPPLSSADATFVQMAAQGGMAEIQAGQLALQNAKGPKVKSFAQKMISDHTAANDQLKQLVSSKSVTLPTAPNDMEAQAIAKLQPEKGWKFDRDYIANQVEGHEAMLQAFQTEEQSGTDPDLKKFASDTLPVIQQHLQMAQGLETKAAHHMRHHKKK